MNAYEIAQQEIKLSNKKWYNMDWFKSSILLGIVAFLFFNASIWAASFPNHSGYTLTCVTSLWGVVSLILGVICLIVHANKENW